MFKAIALALIPIMFCVVGIVTVLQDKTPEVATIKGGIIKGYENAPELKEVTASPSYRWKNGGHILALVVFGFLLFALSGALAYVQHVAISESKVVQIVDGRPFKGSDKFVWTTTVVCWLVGMLSIWGVYAHKYYNPNAKPKTTMRITVPQYEQYKDNLDLIFELDLKGAL